MLLFAVNVFSQDLLSLCINFLQSTLPINVQAVGYTSASEEIFGLKDNLKTSYVNLTFLGFKFAYINIFTIDFNALSYEEGAISLYEKIKSFDAKACFSFSTSPNHENLKFFSEAEKLIFRREANDHGGYTLLEKDENLNLYDNFALLGVFASKSAFNEQSLVLSTCDEKILSNGISFAIIYGDNVSFYSEFNLGFTGVGALHKITATQDFCTASKIDNKEASYIYKDYFSLSSEDINFTNASNFPFIKNAGSYSSAICPMSFNGDNISFCLPIKEQDDFTIGYVSPLEIKYKFNKILERFSNFDAKSSLLFSCITRTLFLQREDINLLDDCKKYNENSSEITGLSLIYYDKHGGTISNLSSAFAVFKEEEIGLNRVKSISDNATKKAIKQKDRKINLELMLVNFLSKTTKDLNLAIDKASSANKAKSEFLSSISHEIRTPINAIIGMNEMIIRDCQDTTIVEYAKQIQESSSFLLSQINDILDFSKIESGRMDIIEQGYKTSSLISSVKSMIAFRAENKGLKFILDIDKKLPKYLHGDEYRIRQVLLNLLTNAIKYTMQGKVKLSIKCDYVFVDKDKNEYIFVNFAVSDTGIGIKQEDIHKLFEAFVRIEEEKNRSIEGTGLGIVIAIKLLNLMNSRLEVESTYGKGSTFSFSLVQRVIDKDSITVIENQEKANKTKSKKKTELFAPKANILVVDDNAINRKVFCSYLNKTAINIAEADGGEKALKMIAQKKYDMIFLDHMMPVVDGLEVIKKLKEDEENLNFATPIFALTANAISGAEEFYLSHGFDGYLSKPIEYTKLEKCLLTHLEPLLEAMPKEAKSKDEKSKTFSNANNLDDLPKLTFIDYSLALYRLNDKDLIISTIKDFTSALEFNIKKLSAYKNKIINNIKDIALISHSIKSTSALCGIMTISGLSYSIEIMAKNENITALKAMFDTYLASLNDVFASLKEAFFTPVDTSLAIKSNKDYYTELFYKLSLAMNDYDLDSADEIIAELKKLDFSYFDSSINEDIQNLASLVTAVNKKESTVLIEQILTKF